MKTCLASEPYKALLHHACDLDAIPLQLSAGKGSVRSLSPLGRTFCICGKIYKAQDKLELHSLSMNVGSCIVFVDSATLEYTNTKKME